MSVISCCIAYSSWEKTSKHRVRQISKRLLQYPMGTIYCSEYDKEVTKKSDNNNYLCLQSLKPRGNGGTRILIPSTYIPGTRAEGRFTKLKSIHSLRQYLNSSIQKRMFKIGREHVAQLVAQHT